MLITAEMKIKLHYDLASSLQVHDRVGDAISRGERKQPLQVVSLSKLCANIKMGMWELIRLVLISWYMSMNVFVNDDAMFPYVVLVERTVYVEKRVT